MFPPNAAERVEHENEHTIDLSLARDKCGCQRPGEIRFEQLLGAFAAMSTHARSELPWAQVNFVSSSGLVSLRPPRADDADALYSDLIGSAVTKTIVWEGPESLESYRQGLRARGEQTRAGELHMFTIVEEATGGPVGTISVREEPDGTWTTGLWIAERVWGRGLGSSAVEAITRYAVNRLALTAIEAHIFVGNDASRRAFEKNGYVLAETRPNALPKRGRPVSEWVLVFRS